MKKLYVRQYYWFHDDFKSKLKIINPLIRKKYYDEKLKNIIKNLLIIGESKKKYLRQNLHELLKFQEKNFKIFIKQIKKYIFLNIYIQKQDP